MNSAIASTPYFRASARTRDSPVRHAAICASKSASTVRGARTLAPKNFPNGEDRHSSSSGIRIGGKTMPSWNTSVARALLAAAPPPRSR